MLAFLLGFAAGVVAGPTFLAKVWPKIKAWFAEAAGDDE